MSICHLRSKEMFSQRHQRESTQIDIALEKKLCIVIFRLMFYNQSDVFYACLPIDWLYAVAMSGLGELTERCSKCVFVFSRSLQHRWAPGWDQEVCVCSAPQWVWAERLLLLLGRLFLFLFTPWGPSWVLHVCYYKTVGLIHPLIKVSHSVYNSSQ